MNRLLRAGLMAAAPLLLAACSGPADDSAPKAASTAMAPVQAIGAGALRLDPALDAIIAPATPIMKVATGYKFLEGPLWHGNELWFSDLAGNTLNALGADGTARVLMPKSGGIDDAPEGTYRGSNGAIVDQDGSVLIAQHGARRLARLDAQFAATAVVDSFEGKKLNSPNDMAFHPDGSLWFSDPPFGLAKAAADPAIEQPFKGVYRWADGKLTAVIRDLPLPNGLAFSPDGKVLYVANSGPAMFVQRYDVGAGGRVSGGRRFADFPQRGAAPPPDVPDGLKVDSAGNVWATGPGGIRIYTPDGRNIGQIRLPEVAANLTWGGPDLKTVYITASTSLYSFPTLIAGAKPLYPK
jgi:gluconolactonase